MNLLFFFPVIVLSLLFLYINKKKMWFFWPIFTSGSKMSVGFGYGNLFKIRFGIDVTLGSPHFGLIMFGFCSFRPLQHNSRWVIYLGPTHLSSGQSRVSGPLCSSQVKFRSLVGKVQGSTQFLLSGGECSFMVVQIIWFQVSLDSVWMFVDSEKINLLQSRIR